MEQRIQKLIAASGLCSRRSAEALIAAGRVRLNGNTAALGDTADDREDVIEVDGKRLPRQAEKRYLMLNKPRGYVTTMHDEQGRKTAFELVQDCGQRVYPVGRLDLNSEGLLLFTNDGAFANRVMHPRRQVEKAYLVWVSGFAPERVERLRQLRKIGPDAICAPQIRLLHARGNTAELLVVIHEGKNRQIRRMCEAVELRVTRLRRIREGAVSLGDLPSGSWRDLTAAEIAALQE